MPTTTPQSSLESFIAHARSKGMDHQTIRMLLLSAGWKEHDVAMAIGAEGLDVAVPTPPDAGGARDAFFHLLAFAGLYTSVVSFILLAFAYINRWFPDAALERYATDESFRDSIRWPLAALIVAFPIFLWMTRLLVKEMRSHSEKQSSGVRRWLTYLTLFVAASVLMGDLITLVFSLLSGDITVRFLLKVVVVFLVAGGVFTYYFYALRKPVSEHGSLHRNYAFGSIAVVALTIVYGLFMAGSPGTERDRKIDAQRLAEIRVIADATLSIVYGNDRWSKPMPSPLSSLQPLPESLEAIASETVSQRVPTTDPEGIPYEYRIDDRTHFSVCSTFHFDDQEQYAPFWNHPAGEHCYEFDTGEMNVP
ncbi:hypothetical protein A3C37_01545 [Candidatus Peribacteria bacterium RIFCSPHIGHO2_02_FULL_53_20]|nr:MAG: hypothetical protein A3C37_01545 [Candidatus Peribacteria bacterium RIFCSPHIGHO2_02_FULL_53_20]OGJ75035.1 MAG: hypothetical protein A3G69_02025 [Candidatus Peribacteria bacterium RIFCSPLOWO2_12_FULL_53_10]